MQTLDDFMPDSPDASGGGDLEVLRLSETPALVAIFTNKIGAAFSHYLDLPDLRAELRCNVGSEHRCLLCDLKHKRTSRAILPVFDVAAARVKAILISDTRDPHALGPQLKAELRKGDLDKRYLALSRVSNKFTVRSVPAKPSNDMGEGAIAGFIEKLKSGLVSLERVLPVYPNSELWELPELERMAEAVGLARADYLGDGGKVLEAVTQ
jgi:hypothetical protein